MLMPLFEHYFDLIMAIAAAKDRPGRVKAIKELLLSLVLIFGAMFGLAFLVYGLMHL